MPGLATYAARVFTGTLEPHNQPELSISKQALLHDTAAHSRMANAGKKAMHHAARWSEQAGRFGLPKLM